VKDQPKMTLCVQVYRKAVSHHNPASRIEQIKWESQATDNETN